MGNALSLDNGTITDSFTPARRCYNFHIMGPTCPFCDKDIKKRAIENGAHSIVLLSNPRLARGHLLIIPKRHIALFDELNSREVKELFSLLAKYQKRILKNLSKGTEIRQNYKPYYPNSKTHVNHFHFHIVPRDDNDEISVRVDKHRKPLYEKLGEKEELELEKLFKKIF